MINQALLEQHIKKYPFRFFETVASSNDIAQAWLKEGADALSLVIANEQQQGRGRKGRFWHTPAGVALAVSVILMPHAEYAHRISMIGALAVYDLCEHLGIRDVGIKWPNDVQIHGKKVSGVLPEAIWENDKLLGVILGIGVNVRVDFTAELAPTATNLEDETAQSLHRAELLGYLIDRVAYWSQMIASDELFATWESRLNTIGQQVQIDDTVGLAQGVDASGALLIKTADGSIQRVLAGDVIPQG